MNPVTIAVVGGGFSGAAVAYHLARARVPSRIVVFEPRELLGAGLAYGGAEPTHRINVPASRMSLVPNDESQFSRWLVSSGTLAADPDARQGTEAFARRRDFGRYVDAMLRPFVGERRIEHARDRVVEIDLGDDGWRIMGLGGQALRADLVVLATTHPAAAIPRELAALVGDARLIADAIADDALGEIRSDERVLIVGAGLTAADIVATLAARGHVGPIVAISRRGQRSRGHSPLALPPEGDFASRPARKATELLIRVRRAVREAERAGRTWHPVFDALRAQGGAIWNALEPEARRRVARHLRPFWDAHRFRVAPQIEALIERKLADRSLEIRKARLGAIRIGEVGIEVELREPSKGTAGISAFDRIVLATGPAHGAILETQPALRGLAAAGLVSLDATGLGLRTSPTGRAVGPSGAPQPNLFVAGPLARGTFGELMGLPQVSVYSQFIAEQIQQLLGEQAPLARANANSRR